MSTMKNKLATVMRSCVENSPTATASMVKFHDGNLVAYGGAFCVQVPFDNDLDCAFSPRPLLNFFRKDREGVTYALSKGKLVVTHKRERVSIHCLDGSAMPIIDIHDTPTKVKKFPSRKAFKNLVECINSADQEQALQGIALRGRMAIATDRKVILALPSGLSKKVKTILPFDTVKFMSQMDDKVTHYSVDGTYIKFYYDSGMTVCSNTLPDDQFPMIDGIIATKGEANVINPKIIEELRGIKCGRVTVSNKGITYVSEDKKSIGELRMKSKGKFSFTVTKKLFDIMTDLTIDNTIYIDKGMKCIHANGKKHFKMVLTTYNNA